jgi:hypothetical protein
MCTCVFLLCQKYFNMILDNNTSLYDGGVTARWRRWWASSRSRNTTSRCGDSWGSFPEPTPGSIPVVLPEGWARRTLMAGIVRAARVSRVVMLFKQWKTGHNTRLVSSKNSLFSLSCVWVLSAGEYRRQPSSISLVRGDKNKNRRRNGERGLGLDERTGGEDSSDKFGVARGE